MCIILFTDWCFQESSATASQASESAAKGSHKSENKDKKEDAGKKSLNAQNVDYDDIQ